MKLRFSKHLLTVIAILLSTGAVLSGCCHAETFVEKIPTNIPPRNGMQPVAVGKAYNSGYYLFNTWPIYTGDPVKFDSKDYHSFHDDIRPDRNANMLLRSMQKRFKAEKLVDVEHSTSSWGYFSLWIIWRKTISTSAVGVKHIKADKK